MRKPAGIFALLLLMTIPALSQQRITKKQLDMFEKNLKDNPLLQDDPDFKANSDNNKWADESAVILCQKTVFNFDRKGLSAGKRIGRNLTGLIFALPTLGTSMYWANASNDTKILIEEKERRKILLRDKFAVDQYSILYFRLSTDGDAFSARVIKKNGETNPVDITDAIRVEDIKTVPGMFRTYTDSRITLTYRPDYFKVAVPDLEEGDILEYEFKNFNTQAYTKNPNYKEFEPVYYVCNRELPVAKQVIEVIAEDDRYYIGSKSMKGAPDFVQTTVGKDKVFRWVDDNRDKMEDTRYVNEFIVQPSVKFQVIYARNNSKGFVWFNEANKDGSKDMTKEELIDNVRKFWFNRSLYVEGAVNQNDMADVIYKSLKKSGVTEATEDEYIKKAYYAIRARTLYDSWNDMLFAKVFAALLSKKQIPHEIIATTSNQRTELEKVAFTKEIAWMVKVKGKYYCNPNDHFNPEDIPVYLAGNNCIRFNYKDEKSATSDMVPASDTAANVIATQINANLDATLANIVIDKTVEAKGMVKDDIIDNILAYTPFMENDSRNYDGAGMWDGMNGKESSKAMEDFTKQKQEWKEEKPKIMKEMAEEEYDTKVEKYDNFRVQQDGRSFKKKSLRYNEDFTLSGLTATAGNDLIVSLPALIGSQTKIDKDERTRVMPVDLRYPRKVLWHLVLTIPDGYEVKGLDNLQKQIDNTCGTFTAIAAIDGNKLVIDVRKIYKGVNFESNQWPLVLQILDAAYNFSQAKVILKKL